MQNDPLNVCPRLVLGGVSSGVGKTTTVAAIAAALRARGLRVGAYKAGPDYLDPGYHRLVTGRACHNLDGWMMGRDAVRSTFVRTARDLDLALLEGVMGLFDGASPTAAVGSTAELAKWLEAPVVLVADAGGLARSIAAVFDGFRHFDAELDVAGLIANRVGSRGHLELLGRALGGGDRGPLLGGFPKNLDVSFPGRHLGLVTASEELFPASARARLGELAEEWLDLDRLVELARSRSGALAVPLEPAVSPAAARVRIAVARDDAFHFYYEENLRLLEAAGAELVHFSPVADKALPEVDGVILGGGYPELFARELAANTTMLDSIRAHATAGRPVYGECGGLMYMSEGLVDGEGSSFDLLGLIPGRAHMRGKLVALGYVEVELQDGGPLGPAGTRLRGHQFRYSDLVGAQPGRYRVRKRRGGEAFVEGYGTGAVLGSYVHAHWASHPEIAAHFVAVCAGARR